MENEMKILKEDLLDRLELTILEKLEESLTRTQLQTSMQWIAAYKALKSSRNVEVDQGKNNETIYKTPREIVQSLGLE